LDGEEAAIFACLIQRSGSNALETAEGVYALSEGIGKKELP